MIKTRLVKLLSHAKRYIVFQVLWQWLSLLCQVLMIYSASVLIEKALFGGLVIQEVWQYAGIVAGAVIVRFFCDRQASYASFKASVDVKRILREKIYDKLLRLGASYRENVATSEVVQMAAEGVEQLETYFGRYLPQLFYSLLAPVTLFVILMFVNWKASLVLLICVPLIPVSIVAVQKFAKKLLNKYWGIYTELGDSFLENLQGLTTLKIYKADGQKAVEMDEESQRFRQITMKVLTMQLNSITIMDLIAASLQIRKHKVKAIETVKRKACRKRWLLLYENLILRFIAGQDIEVFRDVWVGDVVQRKARKLTDDLQNERPRFGVEVHGGVVDSADVLLNVASVKYVFNIAGGQKAVEYIDKAYALVDAHAGDPAVECLVHVFCAAGNFLQRMECTVRHLPRERVVLHNAHLVAFHNGVCTVIFKQHADERAFRNDFMYAALNAPIFFGFERVADETGAVERVDALNTLLNFRVAEHARVGCKVAAFGVAHQKQFAGKTFAELCHIVCRIGLRGDDGQKCHVKILFPADKRGVRAAEYGAGVVVIEVYSDGRKLLL